MLRKFYDPLARFMATCLAHFLNDIEQSNPDYGRELRASVLKMLEE